MLTHHLQWFRVFDKKTSQYYCDFGTIVKEENGKCYLKDGTIHSSSDKCERMQYPLRPSYVKW